MMLPENYNSARLRTEGSNETLDPGAAPKPSLARLPTRGGAMDEETDLGDMLDELLGVNAYESEEECGLCRGVELLASQGALYVRVADGGVGSLMQAVSAEASQQQVLHASDGVAEGRIVGSADDVAFNSARRVDEPASGAPPVQFLASDGQSGVVWCRAGELVGPGLGIVEGVDAAVDDAQAGDGGDDPEKVAVIAGWACHGSVL